MSLENKQASLNNSQSFSKEASKTIFEPPAIYMVKY